MSARLAYPFIYHTLTSPLPDDARLEVDALLGDAEAGSELRRRRVSVASEAGFEIG